MKLLALETSTVACSVALQVGDQVFERHELQAREHTRLLLPMISEVLAEGEIQPAALDAVVLGNGPGSFIGLRIAASVAQGLCYAAGTGLVPVSSLAAVALEAVQEDSVGQVLVAQDAHMQEVYLAGYGRGDDGLPVETLPVTLQGVEQLELPPGDWWAAGHGWQRQPRLMELNRDRLAGHCTHDYPRASSLLPLGRSKLARDGALDPAELEPAYVREQVAVPAADR